jgi:type III restriction enzyme
VFLDPYFSWAVEMLTGAIVPGDGDGHELPRYEAHRGPGSTGDVDFWTSRPVREVERSHLNYVVADTEQWEQSAEQFERGQRPLLVNARGEGQVVS